MAGTAQQARRMAPELPLGRDAAAVRQRIEAIERLLERSFTLPGTSQPVGLDAIVGLVPVAGDALGALLGLYTVWEARNLGMSRWQMARMLGNVGLDAAIGADATRVILPITDPYVVHHGALGSFATVYVNGSASVASVRERVAALPGIDLVLGREEASARFELPANRIGDLVVVSERLAVLGTSPARHDLTALDAPLRSHGGLSEQKVPLVFNVPLRDVPSGRRWRNFDVFDLALNATG